VAHHEEFRKAELLDRLLRYDPAVVLEPTESTPALERELAAMRLRLAPRPALYPRLLGEACSSADILVVARCLPNDVVEFTRFDGCQEVGRVELPAEDTSSAALALAPHPPAEEPGARVLAIAPATRTAMTAPNASPALAVAPGATGAPAATL